MSNILFLICVPKFVHRVLKSSNVYSFLGKNCSSSSVLLLEISAKAWIFNTLKLLYCFYHTAVVSFHKSRWIIQIFSLTKHYDSPTWTNYNWLHCVTKTIPLRATPSLSHTFVTVFSNWAEKFLSKEKKTQLVIMYYSGVQKVTLVMRHLLVMVVNRLFVRAECWWWIMGKWVGV